MSGPALVWFRRDLRLDDNPAWAAATRAGDEVVALFVVDPKVLAGAGAFRVAQWRAELVALDARLSELGGRLLIRRGDPTQVVPTEVRRLDAGSLHFNLDVSPASQLRDARVRAALPDACDVGTYAGTFVLPPGSVVTDTGTVSRVFSAFHRRWRATPWDRWPEPGSARIADDPGARLGVVPGEGGPPPRPAGEDGAHATLRRFLDGPIERYRRNHDAIADSGTSELAVHLKFGTISPRRVVLAAGDAEGDRAAFVRQLAWRDWFAHLLAEHPTLTHRAMRPEYDTIAWRDDPDGFDAWRAGRTGYPIVDAGMRQLQATGSMHNRVRMITASFLVKDLLIDWRRGETHFRSLLTDGDVAQNVGNWQWVAGTGADAAPYFRIFNPVIQSRTHDPHGHYLRAWLPELAALDDDTIHAPWTAGPLELAAAGIALGADYPAPIVDHGEARDRTLAVYRAARRSRV